MPRKSFIKKHSVKANLHVVELTRAGRLWIWRSMLITKDWHHDIGSGSLLWYGGKTTAAKANSLEPLAAMMDELAYGGKQ